MRLRLVAPIEATLLTHWRAPCTDGWQVTLTPPLDLVVLQSPPEGVTCIYCLPEPRARFQRRHVPWWDRWRPDYGGLSLLVESDALRRATVRDGCVTTVTSIAESRA